MSRVKSSALKKHLAKEIKSNRSVPIWVIVRTKREVRSTPSRRHWRRNKLRLKTKKSFRKRKK